MGFQYSAIVGERDGADAAATRPTSTASTNSQVNGCGRRDTIRWWRADRTAGSTVVHDAAANEQGDAYDAVGSAPVSTRRAAEHRRHREPADLVGVAPEGEVRVRSRSSLVLRTAPG